MTEPIVYLDWVKRKAPPPTESLSWGLALSGLPDPQPEWFQEVLQDLPLFGANHNFWLPLKETLAQRYHCLIENVLPTFGTSQANFIAISALVSPNDSVLVETPVYEPLVTILQSLTSNVHFIKRRPELQWSFDLDELKSFVFQKRPKVVVFTNPHNPTGTFYRDNEIQQICALAQEAETFVLIDEVYRDAVPELQNSSAFQMGTNVLITSSLTKCYGLSALRAGWVIAPSQIIQNAEYIHDRLTARNPFIWEELIRRILNNQQLMDLCGKNRWNRLTTNQSNLKEIANQQGWEVIFPSTSLIVFVQIKKLSWDEIYQRALREGVLVTAGNFFGDHSRFRIALTAEPEEFQKLINKLLKALN
ncbi:MAG: pyridoxal phosphate-dependent aminotransferase [bacterium]|nr:pyridoxal phosphate-dependent aminotransferase [bacterium]